MSQEPKSILYVDDDADDREWLMEAFKNVAPGVQLLTARHGLDALNYLDKVKEKCEDLPNLIVLDLNMPFLSGQETFERLKSDARLKDLPIVIFTSGEKPADRIFFERNNVCYINKPVNLEKMKIIVGHMLDVCK